MKNKTKKTCKYYIFLMMFIFVMFIPQNVFAAGDPTITISTEKDEFTVGDEIGVKFQLDTGDASVTSIDLLFLYNNEFLEFQDADLSKTGVQISTVSSSFKTITRNIVDTEVGEIKFSGSKIGGVTGEIILFNAIFKVLKGGEVTIGTDNMVSKIYDTSGVITYVPGSKTLSLLDDDEPDTVDNSEDINLEISHTPPLAIVPNQDLILQLQVLPDDQVKEVRMYFKNSLDASFVPVKLSSIGNNKFQGDIPKAKVVIGDIQYFFGIIDKNDKPHRYPQEDDKFLQISVKLNSLSTNNTNNKTLTTISSKKNNIKSTKQYSYKSNTNTGPEVIYIFIACILTMFGYVFMGNTKGKVSE